MLQILKQTKAHRGQQYLEKLSIGEALETISIPHGEKLSIGEVLEMVRIPPGEFCMGSPETEIERYDDEGPQHWVNIDYEFFMGKYPITQGQWKAVVETVGQIAHPLETEPASFKEDFQGQDQKNYSRWLRPVEQVSWQDAMEFCARLSQKTGRFYRLPSEAEWEYVCRAVAREQWAVINEHLLSNDEPAKISAWNQHLHQPFYFGETIVTDVANYRGIDDESMNWKGNYGRGPKGIYREQTTPVGYFNTPNNFGLHDLHGNVWEWCLDPWHENYQENPPKNGRVWDEQNIDYFNQTIYERLDKLIQDSQRRVVRGGSWSSFPRICRSAYRGFNYPDFRYDLIGFRVVCEGPRP